MCTVCYCSDFVFTQSGAHGSDAAVHREDSSRGDYVLLASKAFYITAALHGQPRASEAILLIFLALTSSVTLNLFSKATNFCLKLGCCNRRDTQGHFLDTEVRKKKRKKEGREDVKGVAGGGTVAIKFA